MRAALVGRERVDTFPSVAAFLILLLCLTTACQRKTVSDGKPTDQANQSGQSNQDTQTNIDKGDLKLSYQARRPPIREVQSAGWLRIFRRLLPISMTKSPCHGTSLSHFRIATNLMRTMIRRPARSRFVTSSSMSITGFGRKIKDKAKLDDADSRGCGRDILFTNWGTDWWTPGSCQLRAERRTPLMKLSALVLIHNTNNGEQMALDGAMSFKLYADLDSGQTKILLGRAFSG